ncbi:hypothetical protein Tco_1421525 [Tanacetum coccineum]
MDENMIRLWLKEQADAAEKLAHQHAAYFQVQLEALRVELQATKGMLQARHGGGGDQGSLLQRSMRLDVPKFTGVDPDSWLFSINEYLSLLNILFDQRLRIVGFNLEGAAAEWFCLMTQNGLITDWDRFEESVKNRFGPSKLKLSLQRELLVSNPTTLGDAFSLAHVTKARLDDQSMAFVIPKAVGTNGGSQYQRATLVVKSPLLPTPPKATCPGKFLLLMTDTEDDTGEELAASEDEAVESGDISILNSLVGHGSPCIQWLQKLGKVTHDYAQQLMEFTLLETTYTLKGNESLRMKKISLQRMQVLLEIEDVYGVYEYHGFALRDKSDHVTSIVSTSLGQPELELLLALFDALF